MRQTCSTGSKNDRCGACSTHASMMTLFGLLALVLAGGLVAAYIAA